MAKQTSSSKKESLKPITPTYIIKAHIWSVIISANSIRIILIQPVPWATNASLLQLCFSEIKSTSASNSTRFKLNRIKLLFLHRTNLRSSFDKILKNSLRLLTISEEKKKKTHNINKKKYKTRLLTYNTSNSSWQNLTFGVLLLKLYYIDTSINVPDY